MTAFRTRLAVGAIVAAAVLLVVVAHSRFLFSWDSANFAFAVDRIDIAQHRPHPPGYLGYVFAGRTLRPWFADVNAALIAVNVVALAAAAFALARMAATGDEGRGLFVVATLVFSPLVLFYASVAEIYVSELACVTLVAAAVHEMLRGSRRAAYWTALAVAVTLGFKVSAAVLIFPAVAYGFARAPIDRASKYRALAALAGGCALVALLFVAVEPRIVSIVWEQFETATQQSRVIAGSSQLGFGRLLNRNLRDTFTACLAGLGANAVGLLICAFVRHRDFALPLRTSHFRVPRQTSHFELRTFFLLLWGVAWGGELVFVHIGKPGYVLPILPILALIVAKAYSSLGIRTGGALAFTAAIANVIWFVTLSPPAQADSRPYRDKPLLDRLASDLAPLTFSTLATIRESDRAISALLQVGQECRDGNWVIVGGSSNVDWRRAMFFLPLATALDVDENARRFQFIGRNGDIRSLPPELELASACGLLWLPALSPAVTTTTPPSRVPLLGWRLPAGSGFVTMDGIRWSGINAPRSSAADAPGAAPQ